MSEKPHAYAPLCGVIRKIRSCPTLQHTIVPRADGFALSTGLARAAYAQHGVAGAGVRPAGTLDEPDHFFLEHSFRPSSGIEGIDRWGGIRTPCPSCAFECSLCSLRCAGANSSRSSPIAQRRKDISSGTSRLHERQNRTLSINDFRLERTWTRFALTLSVLAYLGNGKTG